MPHSRFRLLRTEAGGLSLGWSAYKMYRECPRRFWWSYIQGGDGIEPFGTEANEAMLYGSLWHAVYRGRLLGRSDADSMAQVFIDDGLADKADEYASLVEQVVGDMDWYEQQPSEFTLKVLACEQERAVAIGRHEMRGTIDLVGQLDGAWGSRVVVIDHKSTKQPNHPAARIRYQQSRQLTYYLALWSLAEPKQATCDGLVNVVQSFASAHRAPTIQRIWAFRQQHQLDRIVWDFTNACDEILTRLDGGEQMFPENPEACVVYRPCTFIDLCAAAPDEQDPLIRGSFKQRFEFEDMVAVTDKESNDVRLSVPTTVEDK